MSSATGPGPPAVEHLVVGAAAAPGRVGRPRQALSFACAVTGRPPALAPSPQPSRLGFLVLGHGTSESVARRARDPTPITGSRRARPTTTGTPTPLPSPAWSSERDNERRVAEHRPDPLDA